MRWTWQQRDGQPLLWLTGNGSPTRGAIVYIIELGEKILTSGFCRLSSIQNADVIYVFEGGRIVESGTHQELLALNRRYSELVRLQALEEGG